MNTTVYMTKPNLPTKTYFCPNFRKMKKELENKNQRMTTFFLVFLSDVVHKKKLLNHSLVEINCTIIYLRKREEILKNHRKIILRKKYSNLKNDYSCAKKKLGKLGNLLFDIFQIEC
jgi:hypothetical protein